MCIIVEKKQYDNITRPWHDEFWASNQDGMGAVIVNPEGGFTVLKSMNKEDAWNIVEEVNRQGLEAYVHYRMATHGDIDLDMCHPFIINHPTAGDIAVIHNGILYNTPDLGDKSHSDTHQFVYGVLAEMLLAITDPESVYSFIRSFGFDFIIEDYLGTQNRLVIIDNEGAVTFNDTIWHTKRGGDLDGVRLSNTYAWADIDQPRRAIDPWENYDKWWNNRHQTFRTQNSGTLSTPAQSCGYTSPAVSTVPAKPAVKVLETEEEDAPFILDDDMDISDDVMEWVDNLAHASFDTVYDEVLHDPHMAARAINILK